METYSLTEGYIYVLTDKTTRYKIGKTKDIQKRIRELQTGSSRRLYMYRWKYVSDMKKAENGLHKIFSAHRKQGEWFELDEKNINLLAKIFDNEIFEGAELALLKRFGLRL